VADAGVAEKRAKRLGALTEVADPVIARERRDVTEDTGGAVESHDQPCDPHRLKRCVSELT
jgi:hypothetical protein